MPTGTVTKKSAKAVEKEAFLAGVAATLAQAHEAASTAYADYAKTAKRNADGHIAGSCGGAYVVVRKPSYRLRTALTELGEITPGYGGAWHVSRFTQCVTSQEIGAHEAACRAALNVLTNKYGEEGKFYDKSYID